MSLNSLEQFIQIAKQKPKKTIAVAAAEDLPVMQAVAEAAKHGIADALLIGDESKIREIASEISFNLEGVKIINEINPANSAKIAVQQINEGNAGIVMKGMVGSADYLRAILNKENGLRTKGIMSHVGFFQVDTYPKLIGLTDAAQNVAPDINEKVGIMNNAVDLMHRLGVENPKVAVLAAVETVNPKMPATIDAATLVQMNRRNQIKGCIIDGPLALDNAVSAEAAKHKKIVSDVAGDADLFFVPDIEAGNILYKAMTYLMNATVGAVILGAKVPVVLTSRADSHMSKFYSIALAACY